MPNRKRNHISPETFAPFDGLPMVLAVARADSAELLWCNEEFAEAHGSSADELLGSTDHFILASEPSGEQRAEILRPVLEKGEIVNVYQVWRGRRVLTRIWPLDESAFGRKGWFAMSMPAPLKSSDRGGTKAMLGLVADLAEMQHLSRRELELLRLAGEGLSAKAIAQIVHRATKTVENQLSRMHGQLGISSRGELTRFAVERGLLGFSRDEWMKIVDQLSRTRRGRVARGRQRKQAG